jgi:hypothetical protein
MKRRVKVKGILKSVAAILLGLLVLGSWCDDRDESPSEIPLDEEASRQELVNNVEKYVNISVRWINRDGWQYDDGSTAWDYSVSYDYWAADRPDEFKNKVEASSVDSQVYWHEYTTYHPGGRYTDDPQVYQWAGIRCQGLVYYSATDAGYSIDSWYLNTVTDWTEGSLGVIFSDHDSAQVGDVVIMSLDENPADFEHLGVLYQKNSGIHTDIIIHALGVYSDRVYFMAHKNTFDEIDDALEREFPIYDPAEESDYRVDFNHIKYLRLTP